MAQEDGDKLTKRVLESLRRTGYPLELRVAARVRNSGAIDVTQSRHYVDVESEKVRECDVVACWRASRGDETVFAYLVIECKSKPRPWVAFDNGEGLTGDVRTLFDSLWTVEIGGEPVLEGRVRDRAFNVDRTLLEPSRLGHTLVDSKARESEDSTTSDNRDTAWEAVQAAVSAARGFQRDIDFAAMSSLGKVRVVILPLVVTSGKLFRGWLDDDSDLRIEATDVAQVVFRPGHEPISKRCAIVTESGLDYIIDRAEGTTSALLPTD